jgi:hypothetical protein
MQATCDDGHALALTPIAGEIGSCLLTRKAPPGAWSGASLDLNGLAAFIAPKEGDG